MKIPNKITKAQHTALSKKNYKFLTDEINSQQSDLLVEAAWLSKSWLPDNKFHDKESEEHKITISYWNKEVKASFREFKRDRVKIDAAYARTVSDTEKAKSIKKNKLRK